VPSCRCGARLICNVRRTREPKITEHWASGWLRRSRDRLSPRGVFGELAAGLGAVLAANVPITDAAEGTKGGKLLRASRWVGASRPRHRSIGSGCGTRRDRWVAEHDTARGSGCQAFSSGARLSFVRQRRGGRGADAARSVLSCCSPGAGGRRLVRHRGGGAGAAFDGGSLIRPSNHALQSTAGGSRRVATAGVQRSRPGRPPGCIRAPVGAGCN
jgi:hypothetical protein